MPVSLSNTLCYYSYNYYCHCHYHYHSHNHSPSSFALLLSSSSSLKPNVTVNSILTLWRCVKVYHHVVFCSFSPPPTSVFCIHVHLNVIRPHVTKYAFMLLYCIIHTAIRVSIIFVYMYVCTTLNMFHVNFFEISMCKIVCFIVS